jgi:hypothetical protein
MGAFVDLMGKRFGKLLVVARHEKKTKHNNVRWVCRCDCGKTTIAASGNLRNGHYVSCGCVRRPHGGFGTALHNVWCGMKKRCLNPNNHGFADYGGRGIKVCEEWMEFVPFRNWATANGYKRGLQIDRRNNNGHYEPGNCRFVTVTANNQNRRTTRLNVEKVRAIRIMLAEGRANKDIAKEFWVPANTISQIKHGHIWGSIDAIPQASA